MALPILPIAAGGIVLLLLMSKKADAAAKSPYETAPPDGSAPPTKEPAPPAKTWKEMSPALQEQVAAALGALGVSPTTGEVTGTPTAEAIQLATQTAALCESEGFYDVAKELNRLAAIAAKKVPTPPAAVAMQQAAPPGLSPEQIEAITRTLTLDRDPKSIAALIEMLGKLPPSPQRDNFVQMAQALLLQLATAQSTTQTMQQIEQVITSPGWPEVEESVKPLPPAIVPVATPAKPPVVIAPTPPPPPPAPVKPPSLSPVLPTPATATAVTPDAVRKALGTRLLQNGVQGPDVKVWQEQLRRDGLMVTVDSKFGPATTAATKAWQSQRGLGADGKVGPATRAAIGLPPRKAGTAPAPAPVKPAPAPAATRVLSQGMSGNDVRAWQEQLRRDGFAILVDGIFGSGTTNATKTWQKQRGLTPDGKVGPATRAAIGRPANTASTTPQPAAPKPASTVVPSGKLTLDNFPDPNPSAPLLQKGSPKSDYVASYQRALNAFGYDVGNPDGIFGANTEKKTKEFQAWSLGYYKDPRISVDGKVGPITRRLVRLRAAELIQQQGKAA